jgi:D-tyrosyl-tRNA(Tyr) deacylase
MKALLQRVSRAQVHVAGESVAAIDAGLVVFVAVLRGDGEREARRLAQRVAEFRCFGDDAGRMNVSLLERKLAALVVSQFTLAHEDLPGGRAGRRPSFDRAADPASAERHYLTFVETLRELGVPTATGVFRAHMEVALTNDGPVTFLLEERPPSLPPASPALPT